jgi:hypothetical protein
MGRDYCILIYPKPAKRRAAAPAEASAPKARQSKLAKEHNITGAEENEIKEAFALFSIEKKGEKEGVIPIDDVRRAMMYFSCLDFEINPLAPHCPPPCLSYLDVVYEMKLC